nr:hypothetical protein HK105_004762 [Polyrhizophydium stewartii]
MSFLFGGEKQQETLDKLASSTPVAAPGGTDDSPLSDAPEAPPGAETTTMHFAITTKLGWIAWKEKEASLFSLFERAFGATRCELKFSDFLDQMAMEVEIPNTEIDKFTKYFTRDTLAAEIDKIHGIEPALRHFRDIERTQEVAWNHTYDVKSSLEALSTRIGFLESCGTAREKEVGAIVEMAATLMRDMSIKFDTLTQRLDEKVYAQCESKLEIVENGIIDVIRNELSFIKSLPLKLSQISSAPDTTATSRLARALSERRERDASLSEKAPAIVVAGSPTAVSVETRSVRAVSASARSAPSSALSGRPMLSMDDLSEKRRPNAIMPHLGPFADPSDAVKAMRLAGVMATPAMPVSPLAPATPAAPAMHATPSEAPPLHREPAADRTPHPQAQIQAQPDVQRPLPPLPNDAKQHAAEQIGVHPGDALAANIASISLAPGAVGQAPGTSRSTAQPQPPAAVSSWEWTG